MYANVPLMIVSEGGATWAQRERNTIKSNCISAWHTRYSSVDRRALQRVIDTVQMIVSCSLLSLVDFFSSGCRATNMLKDPSHCGHHLVHSSHRLENSFSPPQPFENWTLHWYLRSRFNCMFVRVYSEIRYLYCGPLWFQQMCNILECNISSHYL